MNKVSTLSLVLASALAVTSTAAIAQSKDIKGSSPTSGYVVDPRGNVVVDPFGLCWRTGYFTPAMAIVECDPDLVPKPVAAPAPAPAAGPAATPAPAPAPAPAGPTTEKVTFAADAFFDFDKSVLKPEGKAKLDDLSSKLKDIALEVIIAVGHTDSIGSDAYNQKLSIRRSEAVKAYLVSKGVEANRVYTEGKGEKQPVADNKTREGRAKNRRVEIEVVGTRQIKK
jgi:OOP family OmpA-OmpF porin